MILCPDEVRMQLVEDDDDGFWYRWEIHGESLEEDLAASRPAGEAGSP